MYTDLISYKFTVYGDFVEFEIRDSLYTFISSEIRRKKWIENKFNIKLKELDTGTIFYSRSSKKTNITFKNQLGITS